MYKMRQETSAQKTHKTSSKREEEEKEMREKFYSVGDIVGYYQFIKLDLEGKQTILPKKDYETNNSNGSAVKTQSSREEKLCFVADVEKYIEHYDYLQMSKKKVFRIPKDLLLQIFLLKFCPETSKYNGYRHMALCVRQKIERGEIEIPARLRNHNNIFREAENLREGMEEYFEMIGMLITEEELLAV